MKWRISYVEKKFTYEMPKFHEPYYTFKQNTVIIFMMAKNNFKKSQIIKKEHTTWFYLVKKKYTHNYLLILKQINTWYIWFSKIHCVRSAWNVRISHDDFRAPQSDLEVNSKLTVFIYLVVFLLDFHSDFIMVSTRSSNFLDVCV